MNDSVLYFLVFLAWVLMTCFWLWLKPWRKKQGGDDDN